MSENNFMTHALTDTVLSRRSFLKWSTVLGGAAALAGSGAGGGLQSVVEASSTTSAPAEGKWVTAGCWHNCGGRCLLKAYVVDGVVTRVKTDDTHADSPDYPQQRGCPRGRSQRMQVYGADRLKYPMKRKNWAPGGGKKELRGKDEWVRISWDEALDIVASETKRIKETYGNKAILSTGAEIARTLGLYGGFVTPWGSSSTGTWSMSGPAIGVLDTDKGFGSLNDRLEMRKSKLIVMWSANPAWSQAAGPSYHFLQAKKAGAKFIFLTPDFNATAQVLADEWIPIRPGTDMTMLLAIAQTLLKEDDPKTNPLIDWDFMNRCTVGFDKDHLPTGADPEDNFKDYVLGLDASGKPAPEGHKNYPAKTPEWAAEICGVPPEKIRSFAREIATTKPTAFLTNYASSRTHNQQAIPAAFITIGCMIGSWGVSGGGVGAPQDPGPSIVKTIGNWGPQLVRHGANGVKAIANPLANVKLNNNEMWDACLTGKYTDGVGPKKDIDIRMAYYGGVGATLSQKVGQTKGIQAHRQKLEFVVSHSYALTTNSKFADIVLPVTTYWERYGELINGYRETLLIYSQVTQPLYESKDDIWIAAEVGKRLGLDPKVIDDVTLEDQCRNKVAKAERMKEDGTGYEPLVGPGKQFATYEDFRAAGICQIPRKPGDNFGYIGFKSFREDPVKNKLSSKSGKIEIHCQTLADTINALGWTKIRPIPAYIPPIEGYEDTFSDWKNKVKGKYPLQGVDIHYMRRAHSTLDNVQWLRQAFPQELEMNPLDAEARGIKNGDTVKVSNSHGVVIRPAYVTNRVMPGVVLLGEGAWVDLDEETGYDKAGATNILSGDIPTVEGHGGWNTKNVQVEKYDKPLAPDAKWPQRIVLPEVKNG